MASAVLAEDALLDVRNPRTGQADYKLPVSNAREIAANAARLRNNQQAWAAMPLEQRIGVMGRWLEAVRARAAEIGETDAIDTGGCHTSYLQGFITMANIGGGDGDAPESSPRAACQGQRP